MTKIIQKMEVDFYSNIEPLHVSLVDQGANKLPFIIAKNEEENMRVLSSILAPKGKEIPEDIKNMVDDFPKAESFSGYDRYEIAPKDICKSATGKMIKLSDDGIMGITHEIAENAKVHAKSSIGNAEGEEKISFNFFQKKTPVISIGEDVENMTEEEVKKMASDSIFQEMMAMIDMIDGSLAQSKANPEMQLQVIKSALDNFYAAISEAITGEMNSVMNSVSIGEIISQKFMETMKPEEKKAEEKPETKKEDKPEEKKEEGKQKEKSEAKKEEKTDEEKTDEEKTDKEKEVINQITDSLKTISDSVSDLVEKVSEFGERINELEKGSETLKKSILPSRASFADDPDNVTKSEDDIFRGVIFKNRK